MRPRLFTLSAFLVSVTFLSSLIPGQQGLTEREVAAYAPTSSVPVFRDDFDDTALDSNVWQAYDNGGTISVDLGFVSLATSYTSAFPYVHTKFNPIPQTGNFAMKVGIQYIRVDHYGTGFAVDDNLPANGSPGSDPGSLVYTIWQDVNLGFMLLGYPGTRYYHVPAPHLGYHEIEFRWLDNLDEYYVDGQLVNSATRDATVPRPTVLWFGNPMVPGPAGGWTHFKIDYVEVDSLGDGTGPLTWTDLGEAAPAESSINALIGVPGDRVVGGTYGSGTPYLFKYNISSAIFTPKMQVPGTGAWVDRLVLGSEGQVYATTSKTFGQGNLVSYDPATDTLVDLGTFGDEYGHGLAVGPDGKVYVGTCCQGRLSIYDPQTQSWTFKGRIISDQRRITALTIASDGNIYGVTSRIWVPPYGSAVLFKFDPLSESTTVIGTIWPGVRESWNIVYNPSDSRLYGSVAFGMTARLFVFDPASPQLGIQDLGDTTYGDQIGPKALTIAPDGKVYALASGHMIVYDPSNPGAGVVYLGTAGEGSSPIAFGPDGRLYGVHRTDRTHLVRSDSIGDIEVPVVSLPYQITDAIPGRPVSHGATFFRTRFAVEYESGPIILSKAADGTGSTLVDDAIEIVVTHPDGTTATFDHSYQSGCAVLNELPPYDISHLFVPGQNIVSIRLYDICGVNAFSSALYLARAGTSLDVTVILARASDAPQPSHDADYFRNMLFPKLVQYHQDNSYRFVNLRLADIIKDNNGSWFTLERNEEDYIGQEEDFVIETVSRAGVTPGAPGADIVVVVHTGPASQTADRENREKACSEEATALCTQTDTFSDGRPWILVSEEDLVGAWAHEVGHDLGLFLNEEEMMLPHPLPLVEDEHNGIWDLMALGSWGGVPQGASPTFMSSISRRFLGLLEYDSKSRADAITMGTRWISAMEISQDNVLKVDLDNAHCYVLETRAQDPPHSFGEESIPKSGLVLYSIDTRGVSTCGDMTIVPGPDSNGNSQETINVAAMLTPGFPCLPFEEHQNVPFLPRTCLTDWGNHIRFTAVDEDATSSTYGVQVQVETATNPLDEQVKGIVMRGGQAFLRVLSHLPGVPLPPAGNPLPIPDNDLHLYTDDGRHVGMNYATGEFENQIADADLSGNQLNGQEWIVVPASTPGLHFIVSNLPTVRFLHMFPQLQSDLGTTDAVEIKGVAAPPYSAPYNSSPIAVDVLIGGFVEVPMEATQNPDGSLTVTLGEAAVTIDSLIAELDSYYAAGAIKTADAYNGLRDKLVAAKGKILKGKNQTAINQLRAFQNQLNADNLVDLFARQTMEQDSQTLINSLSGQ